MASSAIELRVGGEWLSTVATWGNPVVTHRRVGGCWALSWEMDVRPDWTNPLIRQGATVEAFLGTSRIWYGYLPEFDPSVGTFEAAGQCRRLEQMASLNLSGPTNNIDTAMFYAGARGSGIGGLQPFGVVDSAAGMPTNIAQLLDMWMEENPGQYWWVDRGATLWQSTDPLAPQWMVSPGAAALGVTDDDYVTHWLARFVNSATSAWDTVTAAATANPAVERIVSLIDRGPMSEATAQKVVDGLLARTQAAHGWTKPITVTSRELTNEGGAQAGLGLVRAGQVIRLLGLRDPRAPLSYIDAVIGESVWDVDAGHITLRPVDTGARDLRSVVEAIGGEVLL